MCMSSSYAVMAGFMSTAFPVRVRYSAISLSYQVCAALAGGLTPLIGTLLAHRYPGAWWPLAVFYSVLAGVSLVCIGTLERRKRGAAHGVVEAAQAFAGAADAGKHAEM
jgi:MFS family permease